MADVLTPIGAPFVDPKDKKLKRRFQDNNTKSLVIKEVDEAGNLKAKPVEAKPAKPAEPQGESWWQENVTNPIVDWAWPGLRRPGKPPEPEKDYSNMTDLAQQRQRAAEAVIKKHGNGE